MTQPAGTPRPPPKRTAGPLTHRLAAGTLLNAEQASNKHIGKALDDGISEAIAEIARRDAQERRRRAALLAALLLLSQRMAVRVTAAIRQSRTLAREAALQRLRAELLTLGVAIGAGVLLVGGAAPSTRRSDEDDAHARSSGDSLATAWRMLAIHAILKSSRTGEDPTKALAGTRRLMEARVRRTSATESAQAYNDEHRAALEEAIELDPEFGGRVKEAHVRRQWVAMLDACHLCWPHDGEQAPIGQSFSDGAEPGYMHPFCRCVDVLTTDPAARI